MSTQPQPTSQPTQNVLGDAARFQGELSQLQDRRSALTGEIAAATTNAEQADAALASQSSSKQLDLAATSHARVTALQGALSALDRQITTKERQLSEATMTESYEAAVARLVPLVNAAAHALSLYEEHAEAGAGQTPDAMKAFAAQLGLILPKIVVPGYGSRLDLSSLTDGELETLAALT